MEARKITIVSTKTQKKSVIMSEAETLKDLKKDLDAANVDYTDMTFYEGTARVELMNDDSVLPKDVPYTNRTTGVTTITNELVFMLTNTNKKIKSGMTSRAEVYKQIKELNLQDICKEVYGKNFTQCPTKDLIELINEAKLYPVKSCTPTVVDNKMTNADRAARTAIHTLTECLYHAGVIEYDDLEDILNILSTIDKKEISSSYSDEEIKDMFKEI